MLNYQWWIIAKADYRMITSRIRGIRPYLPYLLTGGLAIWIFVIAPSMAESLLSDFETQLFSLIAVTLVQFVLFVCFLIFFILPLLSTLQDIREQHFENLFSTPVTPGNLLLGEFLGKMSIYATLAIIIGSFFTTALIPLGIDVLQIIIILVIFILTFFSASWIGNLTAVFLRSILMKNARGRDIGKGVAFLLVLPPVVIMYAGMGGYLNFLLDPVEGKMFGEILKFLPSSWGAETIVAFALNPGNITAIDLAILSQLTLLIIFVIVIFVGGMILANRLYSLELKSFTSASANPNSLFYKIFVKLLGSGSYAVLVVASWKSYFRTVKNITQLIYVIAIVVILNLFLMQPEDAQDALVSTVFLTPLLAAFVASEIGLKGKECLLLYKQTPLTTIGFLKAKIGHYFLLILPMVIIGEIIIAMSLPSIQPVEIVINVLLISIIAIGVTLFALGLFLRNPAYHDKAPEFMINMQVIIFLVMIPFFFGLIFLNDIFSDLFDHPFYYIVSLVAIINLVVGVLMLYIGGRNLAQME
ncbi:MAG: hypothetical protein ACXAC6_13465 [Candidatus Hodarchaeales archaeon]|jgi:hypothetical protein